MTPEIAARLAACNIQIVAEAQGYCMFVRETCVALVQLAAGRFTSLGSTGTMTEKGLAYLVWTDGLAMLSSHGNQVAAGAEQVLAIQKFSEDLKNAIWAAEERG